jgi:hypothetical protein
MLFERFKPAEAERLNNLDEAARNKYKSKAADEMAELLWVAMKKSERRMRKPGAAFSEAQHAREDDLKSREHGTRNATYEEANSCEAFYIDAKSSEI